MQVAAVWHDEYVNTVSTRTEEFDDNLTPQEIWVKMTHVDYREPQSIHDGYIEDWDAYGSHHKGMITMIWFGPGAAEAAQQSYDRIVASGTKPAAD